MKKHTSFCDFRNAVSVGESLFNSVHGTFLFGFSDYSNVKNCSPFCDYLSNTEKETYNRFLCNSRKREYLFSRHLAKSLLFSYNINHSAEQIKIHNGILGQPFLDCPMKNHGITISHCSDMITVVVFPEFYQIGVDIEKISDSMISVKKNIMTKHEEKIVYEKLDQGTKLYFFDVIQYILSIFTDSYDEVDAELQKITIVWTAKESLSKVLKCGLSTPLEVFEIKSIACDGKIFVCSFLNFPQYTSVSIRLKGYIFSICYPSQLNNEECKWKYCKL